MSLLLMAPRRQPNLFGSSENLSVFAATRATITENDAADPWGGTDAATLVEDATAAATHSMIESLPAGTLSVGTLYTFSMFAKSISTRFIRLALSGGAATFNLSDGSTVNATAGAILTTARYSDDFWRVAISFPATNQNLLVSLTTDTTPFPTSYDGDGADGVVIAGVVIEKGVLSPYRPKP